ELLLRFGEHHLVAALAERTGTLEAGGATTDDENPIVGSLRGHSLGVPSFSIFFAHRRILGAADGYREEVAGDADIAADALTDLVDAPFLDLLREKRIRDRGACGADEIEKTALYHRRHRVGRSETADADDRLLRRAVHHLDVWKLRAFGGE